jgi:hypothetical protein
MAIQNKSRIQPLVRKGLQVVAEYSSKALDAPGVCDYIGGINNNRPNDNDLHGAPEFARPLLEHPHEKRTESPA